MKQHLLFWAVLAIFAPTRAGAAPAPIKPGGGGDVENGGLRPGPEAEALKQYEAFLKTSAGKALIKKSVNAAEARARPEMGDEDWKASFQNDPQILRVKLGSTMRTSLHEESTFEVYGSCALSRGPHIEVSPCLKVQVFRDLYQEQEGNKDTEVIRFRVKALP